MPAAAAARPKPQMKILILSGIFPPDIGGPATYVPSMAAGLQSAGHTITVLNLSESLESDQDVEYAFRVLRLPRRQFKPLLFVRILIEILRQGRAADLLYINGLAFQVTLANLLLRKPAVIKIVGDYAWERAVNYFGLADDFEQFQRRSHRGLTRMLKALRAWWTRRADRVIVPSQYLAQHVQSWGIPQDKIHVIYNAVEPAARIQPASRPLATKFMAITVGRLVPWKHIDQLLEAIAGTQDLGLVIVGDGPQRPYLEAQAWDLQIADKVYFAGSRSKEEVYSLLLASDLFILNSSYEGLPHVLVEALQAGLPVVARPVGGVGEIIQDGYNGILLDSSKADSLTDQLHALLAEPQKRANLSQNARTSIAHLTSATMLQETEAVLLATASAREQISK